MHRRKADHPGAWPVLLILAGLLAGCYEPKEGCTDPEAVNYELDADRSCSDCCSYPQLRLTMQHTWISSGTSFNLTYGNTVYHDGSGHPFRLERISFYLSDFELIRPDGSTITLADSVEVELIEPGGTLKKGRLKNDYLLLNPVFSKNLVAGTLSQSGSFTAIRFKVGLDALANTVDPLSLPEDHPLSLGDSTMYLGYPEGFAFERIDFFRDTVTAGAVSESLVASGAVNLQTLEVPLPAAFHLDPGFHLRLTLEVDYRRWFAGISDIRTAPAAEMIPKIVSGTAQSFSFVDIRQESR